MRRLTLRQALILAGAGYAVVAIAFVALLTWRPLPPLTNAPNPYQTVVASIAIGDTRENAVALASPDSWHHGTCTMGDQATFPATYDLFLYGSREPSHTQVLLLRSRRVTGREVIESVNTVEAYQLFLFEQCLPPDFVTPPGPQDH